MADVWCYKVVESNLRSPNRYDWGREDNPLMADRIERLLYDEKKYVKKISDRLKDAPDKDKKEMYYAYNMDRWFRKEWLVTTAKLKEEYKDMVPRMDEEWNLLLDENWNTVWIKYDEVWMEEEIKVDDISNLFESWSFSIRDIPDMIVNWKFRRRDNWTWEIVAMPWWLSRLEDFVLDDLCSIESLMDFWFSRDFAEVLNLSASNYRDVVKTDFWYKDLIATVMWESVNKWKLVNLLMPDFQKMLNSESELTHLMWIQFKRNWEYFKKWHRVFAEQVATLMWTRRSAYLSAFDLLSEKERQTMMGNIYEHPSKEWEFVKWDRDWFASLSIKDQLRLIQKEFPDKFSSSWERFKAQVKVFMWWTMLDKIDHYYKYCLQPWFYLMAMSFWTKLKAVAQLCSLNTMMYVTDKIAAHNYMNIEWDWWKFAKRFNLLQEFDDWDFDWLDFSTKNLGNQVYKNAQRVWWMLNAWIFNISDTAMRKTFKSKRLAYFFQTRFPWAKTTEDVEYELMRMRDKWNYNQLLEDADNYWDMWMFNEIWSSRDIALSQRVHATEDPFYQAANNIFWHSWDFIKWWWRNKFSAFIKQVWNVGSVLWQKPFDAQYMEMLSNPNVTTDMLNNWLHVRALNNIDAIDFISKMVTAYTLSKISYRAEHDDPNTAERKWIEDVLEMFELYSNFDGNIAALRILPEWQMFEDFCSNLMLQYAWSSNFTPTAAIWQSLIKWTKNMLRWAWLFRWAVEWISAWSKYREEWGIEKAPDEQLAELWKLLWERTLGLATAYSFYSTYEIENMGVTKYVPKSYTSLYNELFWITPEAIADMRDIENDYKTYRWYYFWPDALWNRVKYRIPVIAEYYKWWFDNYDKFWFALQQLNWDEQYNLMANQWIIPKDISAWAKVFWYNKVVQLLLEKNDWFDLDTFRIDKTYWLENEDWSKTLKRSWTNQIYQDIVSKLLVAWIDEDKFKEIQSMINIDTPFYTKRAARALAFVESRVPWSAIEIIWYMMVKDRDELFHNEYWKYAKYSEITDLDDYRYKTAVFDKYSKYLWDADSYRTYPQIMLRVLKDRDDLAISEMISDPDSSEYWEMKLSLKPWDIVYSKKMLNEFNLEALTMRAIAQWDYNAWKMENMYTNLFNPSENDLNPDWSLKPQYAIDTLKTALSMVEKLDTYWLPINDKEVIKLWLFRSLDRFIPTLLDSWMYDELSEEDQNVLQSLFHLMRWTSEILNDVLVEDAEEKIMEDLNSNYKKNWYTTTKNYNTWNSISKNLEYEFNKLLNQLKRYSPYKLQNFKYTKDRNGTSIQYYTEKELEKLLMKTKTWENIWLPWWTTSRSSWGSRSQQAGNQDKPGWSVSQYTGTARPRGAKTEDPDKPKDWSSWWRVIRMRKTASNVKQWAMNATRKRLSPAVKRY